MAILVEVTALYDADPDVVFASALQFEEMQKAMKGLAVYDGIPANTAVKEGDTYTVDVTMFGWMKTKNHVIHTEKLDMKERVLQSREHNPSVKRWDHNLSVVEENGMACWRDCVVIDAGLNTWPTALFASFVYQHRHRYRNAIEITSTRRKLRDPLE